MLLYGLVAAVVIRQHEPLVRDHLARAPVTEDHHSIFQAGVVHIVDGLRGNLKPQLDHRVEVVFLDERE